MVGLMVHIDPRPNEPLQPMPVGAVSLFENTEAILSLSAGVAEFCR